MRHRTRASILAFAVMLGGAAAACGGATSGATDVDVSGLPAWQGLPREAFADSIDSAATGLSIDGPSPRSDPKFRERSQSADLIARVKVTTVTADTVGSDITYHIGIRVIEPLFTSSGMTERSFDLTIGRTSPSYPIAKAFDSRLGGRTFVAFVRRFVGDTGEAAVHWHLAPDTLDVTSAVKEIVALKELHGS